MTEKNSTNVVEDRTSSTPPEPPKEVKDKNGYWITEDTGVSVAAGVVCKCSEGAKFCPRHGRRP